MAGPRHVPFELHPDTNTQRQSERQRRELNEITRELSGVQSQVQENQATAAAATKGTIKFEHLPSTDATLQSGDIELADGVLVKLQHGLGRKLRGWMVADLRVSPAAPAAAVNLIERLLTDGTTNADDSRDLWIKARGWGATITVRILVY